MSKLPVLLLLSIAIIACDDAPITPESKGTIRGNVFRYPIPSQIYGPVAVTGMTVTLEGTKHSTLTDSAGTWELHNVPSGTYNIVFSKPGYGAMKEVSFSFAGGPAVARVRPIQVDSLLPLSTTLTDVEVDAKQLMYVRGRVGGDFSSVRNLRFLAFFGRSANVSSDPSSYLAVVPTGYLTPNPISDTMFNLYVAGAQYLKLFGFQSGDTVHMRLYASVGYYAADFVNYIGCYPDLRTNRYFYPNLTGESTTAQIIMP